MAAFLDVCRFTPTLGGTTDWTYSSAVTGYQSPALAGVVNSRVYKYRAESADLSQWELGEGTYTTGTGVLTRTTVLYNSSGTGTGTGQSGAGTKINFSTVPQVAIAALKEDLIAIEEANAFTAAQAKQARDNIRVPFKGYLFGCTLSTAGASTTFSVAAGEGADSTNADLLTLGSSINKTTAAWAVGAGNGSFDGTGAAPTATAGPYAAFLIKRPDTGVVDILTSLSAISPTLPTNYTLFRRIGWLRTNGSFQWIQFDQQGDNFYWTTTILDLNSSAITTSRSLVTLSAPPNTVALLRSYFFGSGAGAIVIQRTAETDAAVSFAAAPLASLYTEVANQGAAGDFEVSTDASSQIAVRSGLASTTVRIVTRGWIDTRGRLG